MKPSLDTKAGRYFLAKKQGKNKTEAAEIIGIDPRNTTQLERTKRYGEIENYYKDQLLGKITMDEIAEVHARNIKQTKDIGGSNQAIKIALDRIEPNAIPNEDEKIVVILRA